MQKQKKETVEVKEEERCIGTAEYFITLCTCSVAPVQAYGVAVSFVDRNGNRYEQQVNDICCSQTRVETLLELLARNKVTPVTLRDVVEDFLVSI